MKKRDEGYVLPLVLVVLVVICLITVSLLSVSLNNLKNQQAMIERMQDQYEAQGLVEETICLIRSKLVYTYITASGMDSGQTVLDLTNIRSGVTVSGDGLDDNGHIMWEKVAEGEYISRPLLVKSDMVETTIVIGITVNNNQILSVESIDYVSYQISTVEVTRNG